MDSALLLPFLVYLVLNVAHLVAVLVLLKEPRTHLDATGARRALTSAKEAPAVVRDGLRMLANNKVLRGITLVEVFWGTAMIVFESFQPIRLAEILGSEEQAGALMGPVTSLGWGVFALGSALAGLTSARLGIARTAILARILNGLGAVVMGLVAGPVALITAYLVTYTLHGSAGPMHNSLLHREAHARNRATVLSMNSMIAFGSLSIIAPLLGWLAATASNQVAMVTAGLFSLVGAVFYLPRSVPNASAIAAAVAQPDARAGTGLPTRRRCRRGRSVSEHSVGLEGQLDQLLRHGELRGPVRQILLDDSASLAGHAGNVEPATTVHDRVEVLTQRAGAEAGQRVDDSVSHQLNRVSSKKHRNLVSLSIAAWATSRPRAARVGASGPWVMCTSNFPMTAPSSGDGNPQ